MAESNSNIGVRIGGDITPLQQSLKKGSGLISSFTKQARGATDDLVKMGAAAGVAAAGGMAAIYKVTAANTRELKNFSNVANTTVEEFQRLAYGADTVDVSMEKLADILKDVNDRVGDFVATGGGPMADFFENIAPQIGLTVDQFKKLSGPDALQAYYSALEQANLNQQEMTFYLEALASDTTNLIPLLKDGGAGFKLMGEEAQQLGLVMSSIDVAQIEEANKQMDKAAAAFKGAGQAITVELAPYVAAITEQFVGAAKEAGGFGEIAKDGMEGAIKVVAFMADTVHGLQVVFKTLHVVAAGVGTGITIVFNEVVQKVDDLIASMIGGVNELNAQLSRIPGIDIDALGVPEFGRKMDEITTRSIENVKQLSSELHNLAMEPLPSEGVEQFLNSIKTASREAAEEVAAITSGTMTEDQQGGGMEGADPRIEALKERYLTEEELLRQHRETMALIGEEYDASQFDSETQWQSVRTQAMQDHIAKMTALRESEKTSAINITESLGASVMQLAQGQSKRAFEFGKKASIAAAGVKGVQAAIDAWQAGMSTGGPWAPAVAASYAASSLAKTGAMIQSLRSQSFSGGGAQPAAPSGSVPEVATGGDAPNTSASSGGGGQSATISLSGGYLDAGRLVDMMKQAKEDGYTDFNFVMAD